MKKKRALIACEFSGQVRDQFSALGWDAWSCDFLTTEKPGQHIQGDLRDALKQDWDFVGFHTDCTFMCNSGSRWLHTEAGRWEKLDEACELFNLCLADPRPGYNENPIPHKHAVKRIARFYDQIIQPWQFGHKEMKATCLWLRNLPLLVPTDIVGPPPREKIERRKWAKVHGASPGPDRWKFRSRTLPGIAKAFAEQWGGL